MAGKDRPGAGGDDVEEPKRVRWGPGNVSGSRESPTPARSDCRGRRNSARRARSSHSDRAGRYGGVCEINGVDQSGDQTGSAGAGSWTSSRSVTYWSSRIAGDASCGGARARSSASPQWVRIASMTSGWVGSMALGA